MPNNAARIVPPETFMSGYPVWVWRLRPDVFHLEITPAPENPLSIKSTGR